MSGGGFEKRTPAGDAAESAARASRRAVGWERWTPHLGPLAVLLLVVFTAGALAWNQWMRPRPAVRTAPPLPAGAVASAPVPEPAAARPPAEPTPDDPVVTAWRRRALEARGQAEAAEAAGDPAAAERAYLAWREAQQGIHEREPASRHADWPALERIDAALATLRSGALAGEVAAAERAAAVAEARGDPAAAVPLWAAALAAQERLRAEFPRSRHAAVGRAEALEEQRQTAAAAPAAAAVESAVAAVAAALWERRFPEAAEAVRGALVRLDAARAEFPRARRPDPDVRRRLVYLDLQRGALPALQEALLERLLPVPGRPGRRLLATEVPQRLYERLMQHNPSHRPGPFLPVECVSWAEAAAFCERASWILGRPVVLPSADDHRAALARAQGDPRFAAAGPPLTRAIPAARPGEGFADLLGNVAEWLADGEGDRALTAGGSLLSPEFAAGLPLEPAARGTRSPVIGFRFVVE